MQKNENYIVTIENYGCNGEGVARVCGMPVFVENVLQGETVEVRILKVLKNYAYGKVLRVIEPSPQRIPVACSVFRRCGGCQLLHMQYAEQLRFKTEHVKDCMQKFSSLSAFQVAPCEGMDGEPFHYRNKAQYPVADGKCGFYAPRSHNLIAIEQCPVQATKDEALLRIVEAYEKPEEIRNLYVRHGEKETMAVVVTRTERLTNAPWLKEQMKDAGVDTLVQNINTENTNVILGRKNVVLFGKGTVEGKIGALRFTISPHSFFQINTMQTEKLYEKAKSLLELSGTETVLDLYCGIGSIGLFMAQQSREIIGVECVPEAVQDAVENAERNYVKNARFVAGLSEEVFPALLKEGVEPDAVIIDPPRKGCDEALLKTLLTYEPEKILYISCNPATLARDIGVLAAKYTPGTIYPFDLFPQTRHVETIVLLQRQDM